VGKKEILKQLIKSGLYEETINLLLEQNEDLYLGSLLCRFLDKYDLERKFLQQADGQVDYQYLEERLIWHKKPMFDPDLSNSRVVPRSPLLVSRKSDSIPKPEVLERLCFVSGCDSHERYFELLVELVESLKGTALYKDIPFYVLDLGLTDRQKHILSGISQGIVVPNWDFIFTPEPPSHRKCIIARAFLENYFPGYEYYFWLDADSWVQSETSLDAFINMAAIHGISAGRDIHASSFWEEGAPKDSKAPKNRQNVEKFKQSPSAWASSVCYRKDSKLAVAWRETMKELAEEYNHVFWTDQNALNVVMIENNIQPLEAYHAHRIGRFDPSHVFLRADAQRHTLFAPQFEAPVGIVGVINKCAHSEETELQQLQTDKSWRAVRQSTRYRVWPWEDKTELNQRIEKLLQEIV